MEDIYIYADGDVWHHLINFALKSIRIQSIDSFQEIDDFFRMTEISVRSYVVVHNLIALCLRKWFSYSLSLMSSRWSGSNRRFSQDANYFRLAAIAYYMYIYRIFHIDSLLGHRTHDYHFACVDCGCNYVVAPMCVFTFCADRKTTCSIKYQQIHYHQVLHSSLELHSVQAGIIRCIVNVCAQYQNATNIQIYNIIHSFDLRCALPLCVPTANLTTARKSVRAKAGGQPCHAICHTVPCQCQIVRFAST